jgi:hypothetical protein
MDNTETRDEKARSAGEALLVFTDTLRTDGLTTNDIAGVLCDVLFLTIERHVAFNRVQKCAITDHIADTMKSTFSQDIVVELAQQEARHHAH